MIILASIILPVLVVILYYYNEFIDTKTEGLTTTFVLQNVISLFGLVANVGLLFSVIFPVNLIGAAGVLIILVIAVLSFSGLLDDVDD